MSALPRIISALLLTLLLAACGRGGARADRALNRAEALLELHPDSALTILDSLSATPLPGRERRARHALLLTMALDKNFIVADNDSLATIAVDYYSNHGEKINYAKAIYYRGRVRYNHANLASAISDYLDAKEISEHEGNDFWTGMAYRGLADIYNATFNYSEERNFAQLEYEYIKRSGIQPFLNFAIHDYGRALVNGHHYAEAKLIANELRDSAVTSQNPYFDYLATQLDAISLLSQDKQLQAIPLLRKMCESEFAERTDSLHLIIALAELNEIEKAEQLFAHINQCDSELEESLIATIKYHLYKVKGNIDEAFAENKRSEKIADQAYRDAVMNNLTESVQRHYTYKEDLVRAKLKSSRYVLLMVIALSFFVLATGGTIAFNKFQKQQRTINNQILLASQLEESLKASEQSNLGDKAIIKELITTKYSILEQFGSIMQNNSDSKLASKKIADAATQLINDFSYRSETLIELEQKVDNIYGNIISDFRAECSDLKEVDYRLFLFTIINFSVPTIALLLKEKNLMAVYNRKRRIKDKIKKLEIEKQERFFKYFTR